MIADLVKGGRVSVNVKFKVAKYFLQVPHLRMKDFESEQTPREKAATKVVMDLADCHH